MWAGIRVLKFGRAVFGGLLCWQIGAGSADPVFVPFKGRFSVPRTARLIGRADFLFGRWHRGDCFVIELTAFDG